MPFRSLEFGELLGGPVVERSAAVRRRVVVARARQRDRGRANATLEPGAGWDRLDAAGRRLLEGAHARLGLSARAHVRVLRVARTIADLAGRDGIVSGDVAEAIQYRSLDRPPPEPDERSRGKRARAH